MPEDIVIETTIKAPIQKVWEYFTKPEHIVAWNHASDDWCCPKAENDLKTDGKFSYRMEAKDGSVGFDFGGTYSSIIPNGLIAYTIGDGREVRVLFEEKEGETHIIETFEPENENPVEMQRGGWQAILDNFKIYVEAAK